MSRERNRKSGEAETEFLTLALDQIRAYERDPRHSANPEYARIKASILAQGLDQPLVISRRPSETQYIVAAGGNTRLRALQELHAETGDRRFNAVPCISRPWESESGVLLAHLRENDLRGSLTLFDKARAVREVRELLIAELRLLQPSRADLVLLLKARGYALSESSLALFDYLVDDLGPRLPQAVTAISWDGAESLRRLERAVRGLWTEHVGEVASIDALQQTLATLCRRYDSADWDLTSLRQALEAELADRLNESIHTVRLALDARLEGRPDIPLVSRQADELEWPEPKPTRTATVTLRHRTSADRDSEDVRGEALEPGEGEASRHLREHDRNVEFKPQVAQGTTPMVLPASKPIVSASNARPEKIAASPNPLPSSDRDDQSLRKKAYELVLQLAERHGIGELIAPLPDQGTGYLVRDVPNPTLLAQLDEAGLAQTSMLWWQLMACADITVAPVTRWLPHMDADSVLYRALQAQDAVLLFNAVWTLDPGQLGFRLWRNLEDADWEALLELMRCYRTLHRRALAAHRDVWAVQA